MKTNKLLAILTTVTILIGSSGSLLAQSPTLLPLDSAVTVGHLPNGFTYYIRKNAEPQNRVVLYLANKVGSILEDDDQQGLAHFVEHMSFNGTKHFPKNELVSYLQKAGVRFGGDLNAYTSFDETVYQLPLPTDNPELLKNGFQIMRDWAHEALFDSLEIEKERGVILEEKRLGKSAQERMQNKYFPFIMNQSKYSKRIPIGTEEVLKNFKPATIRRFYNDWYRPDLQALIVVGNIDVKETEKTIIELFSDLKAPAHPRTRTEYTIPLSQKNQFLTVTDKEFPVTAIQVMSKFTGNQLKTTADYHQTILRALYNQIIGARYNELSQQSNPPFLQAENYINNFMANLLTTSTTIVGKQGELEKGFKAAWTEIERAKKYGFTETELARAKDVLLSGMESAYNERDKTASVSYANEYLNLFLKGEASPGVGYEYNYYKNDLSKITLSEINELIKEYLTDKNRDILVLSSEQEKANLPTEETVYKWIADVQNSNISAYVDNVSEKPLLSQKIAGGEIISEKKDEKIGITTLSLSNGVKVVLKPTNYKNDEIHFYAYSPGGYSLCKDSEYESAIHASSLASYGGVADYSLNQLEKYLSGKKVSVSPFIGARYEGFTGFSSPKELETALQLVYLYFTQPRKDTAVYKGMIQLERESLINRNSDPSTVFSDTISAVLGCYNFRYTPPSNEKLDKINLDRAFEIYKDRFADASDFNFILVGNFDVATIKPLLEQYLGALPTIKRVEKARDLKIVIPSGKIEKKVFKGEEQKSTVQLVFSGDYQYNTTENDNLLALSEVLDIRLISRLREDESGVYGVGVNASYEKYPRNRYTFTVAFGCAPENVDRLINSTLDEIRKIRENGATQEEINKVIAEERRAIEVQSKENGFWINYLSDKYQNNENPDKILAIQDRLNKITTKTVKLSANKHLSGKNLIRFVLYPEKK